VSFVDKLIESQLCWFMYVWRILVGSIVGVD
jgi:hypothetical protein